MKINNQVHAVFSRTQFEQNLGTKICITLVRKCDDRGIAITANLEFRKFSLTIIYKKFLKFCTLCETSSKGHIKLTRKFTANKAVGKTLT